MSRFWVIAPVEANPAERYDEVWQFDLANNLISIGWARLGDISQLSREELTGLVAAQYQDRPAQTKSLFVNMLWSFYHEIQVGDVVLARRGRRVLAGVGVVEQMASYQEGIVPGIDHANILRVEWKLTPRDKAFPNIVFPMHTVASISDERAALLLNDEPDVSVLEGEYLRTEDSQSFVLEKYLEEFIVSNFNAIFGGALQIFEDPDGNTGQQYETDIGFIDILAKESNSNTFVIIELKKGRPSDQVVGQVLRYMGWVKENLCSGGQAVRGLVICQEPDKRLQYALAMTSNITVSYYAVSFDLLETPRTRLRAP